MAQQIDIVANLLMKVDSAEAGVNKLKNSLSKLKLPDNIDKNLAKSFTNLDGIFERYRNQLSKGFKTKGDVTGFAKIGKELDSEMNRISKYMTELTGKPVDFKINSEPIRRAEQELAKLLEQQQKLTNATLSFKIEGLNDKGGSSIQKILEDIQKIAGDTNAGKAAKGALESLQLGDVSKAKAQLDEIIAAYRRLGQTKKEAEVAGTGMNIAQAAGAVKANIDTAASGLQKVKDEANGTSEALGRMRYDQLGRAATEVNKLAKGMEQNAAATSQANKAAQEYAQSSFNMTKQLEQLQSSTQYFFGLRNMINLFKRGVREAISTIKELDAAMTETAVVTKFDVGDMWAKLPEYTANANALGATVQDMYKSTTLYYQQGLNAEQAMSIASETMKMARIGGLEAAEATDMMTAALRGFNMELNETSAQRINDVYSNLAAKTASNTEELGNAMQRTASIAANAGMSFEGTAAFLAQAIETTREPAENIGTAMKTIIARMQEMKKNPLEIGEVEGEEVDYNKIDGALKSIGISIKKANGDFRDNDEVLLDISKKWDSLSQTQQRYIATTIAGSRQQSRFIAMVGDYERTRELMSYATDSEGASNEQFGKTLDSLEAKLNKFQNAWKTFLMGIMNDSWTKGLVDAGTKVLGIVNDIINALSFDGKLKGVKSFLSIFTAFTGLKMAGRGVNMLLGGLGGMLNPNSSVLKGMFGGGLLGSKQGNAAAQAKMINQPIVSVLNQILGAVRTGKTGGTTPGSATHEAYKKALSSFRESANESNATIPGTLNTLKGLDAQQVRLISKSNVGIMNQLQRSLQDSFADSDVGKVLAAQTVTAMKRGNISGSQIAGLSKANIGKILGTKEAEAYSQNFADKVLPKMQEGIRNANVDAQMKWASGMKNVNEQNQFLDTDVNKLLAKKIQNENGEWVENTLYDPKFAEFAKKNRKEIEEQNKAVASLGNMLPKTNLQKFQQGLSHIGGSAITAGQGLMSLGATLSSMGFDAAGAAVSSFGSTLTNLGMIANGLPQIFSLITKLANPLGIIAVTAGVAAVAVTAKLKSIKKEAEEVTKSFSEDSKAAEDNISKLKSYKEELAGLAKGVDINGNNVNLDDSQYQRYLEIVDDIAKINPEIVKGYNAQGHAIIDNNRALEETLKIQQENQKTAYDTYLQEESLQKLINARNINSSYNKGRTKADGGVSSGYTHGNEGKTQSVGTSIPLAADVSSIADQLKFTKDFDEAILQKYNIESLEALQKGEEKAVRNFVKYREQIKNELSNSGLEIGDAIFDGFDKLEENSAAFDEAIKPIYDNLLTGVSKSNLFESIAPEMQEAFKDGIKNIAAQDLTAGEMQNAVQFLGLEFQDAFDKAEPLLTEADEALNTFVQDLNEAGYNETASDIADGFRELAAEAEAVGQIEIAEWYENQAARVEGAITNSTETIAENIDTLTTDIAAAKSNFDVLSKGIDDYYTLADQAHGLIGTALEEKNIEGEGSKTFWKTYQAMASEEAYNTHDFDTALADMKKFQSYFAEGSAGVRDFYLEAVNSLDEAFTLTNKNGEESIAHLGDFFELAEDGTLNVTEKFNQLTDEQYAQLASVFDLSSDGFTAILNKLRQFGDLDFTDIQGVRRALALDSRTVKTDKKIEIEGIDGTTTANRLYYGESMLKAETPEYTEDDRTKLAGDLEVQGSIILPSDVEEFLTKPVSDGGEEKGLLKQFVTDTKGDRNQVENVMKALVQTGEYDKEGLEKIHSTLTQKGGLLEGATDANVDFETLYNNITAVTDPVNAANDHLSNISSTVNTIAGIVAAGKVGEGFLPDVARQSANLRKELLGKEGIDTWAQYFSRGKDENGYAITSKDQFNEINDRLSEYKTTNDNYIRELEQGREAAVNNGASADTIKAFDDEIKLAKENSEIIAKYSEEAANNYKEVGHNFTEVSSAVFEGLANIRNNPDLNLEGQKEEISSVLASFAADLQSLDFNPEQIQSIFSENFGIDLKLEGGEFASDVGEQIKQQVDSKLGETEINAILNIASIKMGGAAKGKNNTPSAIRRVGTMARGSKRGYTIKGEPTLTGELGPELVWEPKQNAAYMVGENGPQFANLSKSAVVWNAKQTKKIKKNSKGIGSLGTGAYGIHSFGTMAGGNAGGLSIPGTFDLNANAKVKDVIPPTKMPEIPVKAELEVEGNTEGGFFSKIFGGQEGPSINVKANVEDSALVNAQTEVNTLTDTISTGAEYVIHVDGDQKLNDAAKAAQKINSAQGDKSFSVSANVSGTTQIQGFTAAATAANGLKSKTLNYTADVSGTSDVWSAVSAGNSFEDLRDHTVTYTTVHRTINDPGPSTGGFITSAGVLYRAKGGSAEYPGYPKKGTDRIPAYLTPGEYVQNRKAVQYFGIDFMRKINHRDLAGALQSFGSSAKGPYGTIGPKDKGGLTLTGEKGFEIAWIPSENRSMILGINGPQMLKLPSDAVIYTHEQSKKILGQKGIPAGSHGNKTARGGINPALFGIGGTGGGRGYVPSTITETANNVEDAVEETTKKIVKVSVWWENIARKTEYSQRQMDKSQKAFEKYTKDLRATLRKTGIATSKGGGGGDDYIKKIGNYIGYNQSQLARAEKELKGLDTWKKGVEDQNKRKARYGNQGYENIVQVSWTGDDKESREAFVDLAGYIKFENGTYIVDQAQLNKIKDTNQRKATADAANKEIDDRLSKKYKAEDNIAKAQEALEKMSEELYKTFFGWETSLTKIWNITQRIERITNKLDRTESYATILEGQIGSGIRKASDSTAQQELNTFKKRLNQQNSILIERQNAIKQAITDVKNAVSAADERAELATINQKLKSKGLTQTERLAYEQARTELTKKIATIEKAQNYLTVKRNSDGTVYVNFNADALQRDRVNGTLTEEMAKGIEEYVKNLKESSDNLDELYNTLNSDIANYLSNLTELQDQWADYEEQLIQIEEESNKKEVDRIKKLSDSIKKAIDELLKEVKNKLDERRKQEDNAKTEQDIFEKQQRLSMLRADTSGSHAVEIAQLEKEIADAQQNYQRSLEDQLIEKLQNQADKAQEQREKQIEIQEELASSVNNIEQVNQWMANPTKFKKELKQAYRDSNDYDKKGNAGQAKIDRDFEVFYEGLITNQNKQAELRSAIQENTIALEALKTAITAQNNHNLTAKEAKKQGATLREVKNAYSAKELKEAGWNASDFYKAGISASKAYEAGFKPKEIHDAGYNLSQFKSATKLGVKEAYNAGYHDRAALAKEYGTANTMKTLDVSGRYVQSALGNNKNSTAKYLQTQIVNKGGKNISQSDMNGVQVNITTPDKKTVLAAIQGNYAYGHYGSTLWAQKWDSKNGILSDKPVKYSVGSLTPALIKAASWEGYAALLNAIQHQKPGSVINKNFKSLIQAANMVGKEYQIDTGNYKVMASIGGDGNIYYNVKDGVQIWSPSKGTLWLDKYNEKRFKERAKWTTSGREYKQVLRAKGVKGYATGGLADYTGPAWLDGTPAKPELILNAQDTKNFIALKDVLSKAIGSTKAISNEYGGDTTFEININVDHIANDYDVDKMAERVKKIIVKDSSYRNVTQVRKFR